MRSTPWRSLERELGQSRIVQHLDHEDFEILVVISRPWVLDHPTFWSAHITEATTGLTLARDDFIDRRTAEAWAWYRTVAAWQHLDEYRDLLRRQHKENLTHDGKQDDQRVLVLTKIEKMAERDEERDQFSAEFWQSFEADVDPTLDPGQTFVPELDEQEALDRNPVQLTMDDLDPGPEAA